MNTNSYKTKSAKKSEIEKSWYILDAEGEILGRVATKIADVLRGKHKPTFTPHADIGDYVVVINADKIRLTGNKWAQKEYQTYSGYPGGQKSRTAKEMLDKKPTDIIEKAVRGMIPKNKLGRAVIKKLYVYTGTDHPHQAQKPQTFNF